MRPLLLLDASQGPPWAETFFLPWLTGPRPVRVVRVTADPFPIAPEEAGAVVITGSAASVQDDLAWVHRVRRWVSGAIAAGVPCLGVCWGHQMLATAVHGVQAVGKREPEVGFPRVTIPGDDELLGVLAPGLRPFVTHEDFVEDEVDLAVLASSEACRMQAIRVRGRRVWGLQFHVEYPETEQRRILEYRADRHPEAGFDVDAILARGDDLRPAAAALFARFEELI